MSSLQNLAVFTIPLFLLALTGVAGYAFSQIRNLSLPIPQALGLFTVVLPLITGISTQGAYGLIQRSSKNEQYQLTIPLLAVIGFQLVYETIVATLALTYILPPASLACGLNEKWQKLFSERNERAIKDIQDSFNCCGFRTVKDRAWPFIQGQPSPCALTFGRTNSCLGEWRKAEQTTAGLFVLVAVVVFVIKALSIISLLTSSSWTHSRWPGWPRRHESEDNRATIRRLIEEGDSEEPYHDNPRTLEGANRADQGPRVEPSSLLENNAWRTDGEEQPA
ncbi:tetraspanin Tsp3 [Bisporella sp. PMI_857]|nr:tetraspanin Tsp3 [Bisporella sp. PMI_857]